MDIVETVHVVAAIFIEDGKVLACRKAVGKSNEGLWEFPGGKVEQGEEPKNALIREIQEELGIDCSPVGTFNIANTRVGENVIRLETIICRAPKSQVVTSSDHDAFAWLSIHELESVRWSEPDRPAIDLFLQLKSSDVFRD